jgi:cell division protein FtsL
VSSPVLAAVAVALAALVLVAQSAAATQASYQIAALKQEQAQLLAEQDQLQAQLAEAQAPARVAEAAQSLGLGQPAHWQYLPASGSPIALAPPTSAAAKSAAVRGVLAVLATLLGAPTAVQNPTAP